MTSLELYLDWYCCIVPASVVLTRLLESCHPSCRSRCRHRGREMDFRPVFFLRRDEDCRHVASVVGQENASCVRSVDAFEKKMFEGNRRVWVDRLVGWW